jgi:hypothetical protein
MLPYGTLWKLDQMLHPAGPPQRRTVATRRRQALFYFLWGVLLVTVFLFPYHYSSLRRLRLEARRRLRGESAPKVDAAELQQRQRSALERLTRVTTIANEDAADGTSVDFATVFYHHPGTEVRLRGVFDHPRLRELAGAGSGRLWRCLGGETPAAPGARLTLAETATASTVDGAAKHVTCLAALRRSFLVSHVGNATTGVDGTLTEAVRNAVRARGTLSPLTVSPARAAAADVKADAPFTETALAELFLWLAKDTALPEEAIARAVAGCGATLSRSLEISFEWRPLAIDAHPRAKLLSTFREVDEAEPQYVCVCSGPAPANAVTLTDAANNAAGTLSLVDPRLSSIAKPSNCAEVCAVALPSPRVL